jgi:hypothetical protein
MDRSWKVRPGSYVMNTEGIWSFLVHCCIVCRFVWLVSRSTECVFEWFCVLFNSLAEVREGEPSVLVAIYLSWINMVPILLHADHSATQSEAWNVFGLWNAAIVGSNPTQNMDVYIVFVHSIFVILCVGRDLATGWSSVQGVLPTVYWSRI